MQTALKLASSRLSKPTNIHWNFNVFLFFSKVSNSPTLEASVKNLDVIWKNEEHFWGGGDFDSLSNAKRIIFISLTAVCRSICGYQSRLPFNLWIYSYVKRSPNQLDWNCENVLPPSLLFITFWLLKSNTLHSSNSFFFTTTFQV